MGHRGGKKAAAEAAVAASLVLEAPSLRLLKKGLRGRGHLDDGD
ncbi:unnamed protein product [Spirodela intermedia]|uniref:Uncharacterized protein n=1 Tax=Spirodela intermedia TaxID=51605 RepID=A0A7I8KWQ1_SPIIN|nr:unnamed protein product [Spirodela intermedia]